MKKQRNRFLIILSSFGIYALLIFLLYLAEHDRPFSQINSIGDAIWYSIVTLSTVGYGDVTPKTHAGHVIGIIFLITSMGLLVALIGTAISFITSEGLPMLVLRFWRKRNWYYFADFSSESDFLAKDILKEDPQAVIIYGIRKEDEIETPDYFCLFLNVSPARIVALKKDHGEQCIFFFLTENDIWTNMKAIGLHELPIRVYANTTSGRETLSGNIHCFHTYDSCARSYWRSYPVKKTDQNIVLIGFDRYGRALLERAILTNVIHPDQEISYHIFGDASRFQEIHPNLDQIYAINRKGSKQDSLFFHTEDWILNRALLESADRIIICEDDETLVWDILWQIQRYYHTTGSIQVRTNRAIPGIDHFGSTEEIFTANHIIRTRLNDAAIAMNNLYRESVSTPTLDFEELDDLLRQSKIAAADHLFLKLRILFQLEDKVELNYQSCHLAYKYYQEASLDPKKQDILRQIEHCRWMRFYNYYNWTYGPNRDDVLKHHPMILPYQDLSDTQKAHHDFAWELLHEIACLLH